MNIFVNDYNDLCHDEVYMNLKTAREKGILGYGYDEYSAKAKELIKRDLQNEDVDIEFLAGGTIANIVAVSSNLMHYEGVIAVSSGHIVAHEAGAIEGTGHKTELIYAEDGKLTPLALENKINELTDEFTIVPKMVYISQTTEMGTVYSFEELQNIYDICVDYGLYLYIDGARMGVGLAASDVEISDLCDICDIFTLGGTKNGALYGEALVIVSDELKQNVRVFMKQRGAILAKGFSLGLQFEALFRDGLYYKLAQSAYENALKLAKSLKNIDTEFYQEPKSNQIFIILEKSKIDKLRENNLFEVMPYDDKNEVIRFVTTYRTTDEEISSLINDIKSIKTL